MPTARHRRGLAQAHPLEGGVASRWPVPPIAVVAGIIGILVVAIAASGLLGGSSGPGGSGAGGGGGIGSGDGTTNPPSGAPPIPGHELYGFLPYWEMDSGIAGHLAETPLTTLGLFSVTHRANGRMAKGQTGFERITGTIGRRIIRDARERGTRVEVVYSSFGEQKNRRFYEQPAAQDRWIGALVDFVAEHELDGVNVDVELLPADLVDDYGEWVGRLRTALRERMPDGQVSVATAAGERGAAMAAAAAEAGADRIFLMGYDYHYPGSRPGASAPIDRFDGDEKDLVWSLDLYAELGIPAERLVLGLPLYGVTWPVVGPGLGDPSTGRGDTWVPRRNLRIFEDPAFEPTYEPIESVEFYAVRGEGAVPAEGEAGGGAVPPGSGESPGSAESPGSGAEPDPGLEDAPWHAVYYDSPRSLRPKLALADDRGLAGAGFWAIGYERGLPGYRELMVEFREGRLAGAGS